MLDTVKGGGRKFARALWGDAQGPRMVAPVSGAVLPPTSDSTTWDLSGDRAAWLQQSPHALHVLALAGYSKAGLHHGITTLSGIVSEGGTCTALHVENALLGSFNLMELGHPKVGDDVELMRWVVLGTADGAA